MTIWKTALEAHESAGLSCPIPEYLLPDGRGTDGRNKIGFIDD
jgi:hypothetical protein